MTRQVDDAIVSLASSNVRHQVAQRSGHLIRRSSGAQSPEVEAGGPSEMCRCRISTGQLCVSSEHCV